ncbi:MAG: tRNA-guanine transglycosylase, partial [Candidatus Vogelbacteria bacterium]|nr:tRNA-guanine transglycosylase [Candidatus Vogelbacteria bacterium]
MRFTIEKNYPGSLARAGKLETARGLIETPAFVAVATQAALKAVPPEPAAAAGTQAIFANTFHLHLAPGEAIVKAAGGLHRFMNWPGPIFTDSGGFQVFSLGAAYGLGISKIAKSNGDENSARVSPLVQIDDDGVAFRSPRDGRELRLTPEKSIQIQHDLGADIILAFDECTSPLADYEYQKQALARTHSWAERSLTEHRRLRSVGYPALFGIVQGGRFQDLREMSARVIGALGFDGFGIGGSFVKADIDTAVGWVTSILP